MMGKTGSSYDVAYPGVGVQVESSGFHLPACVGTPIALADGTDATLAVTPGDFGPCDGGTGGIDFLVLDSVTETPGGLAIIETAHGTIVLSGPTVSDKTAAASPAGSGLASTGPYSSYAPLAVASRRRSRRRMCRRRARGAKADAARAVRRAGDRPRPDRHRLARRRYRPLPIDIRDAHRPRRPTDGGALRVRWAVGRDDRRRSCNGLRGVARIHLRRECTTGRRALAEAARRKVGDAREAVTITRRQRVAPDGLFRIPGAPVGARVSQVRPGVVPGEGPAAYWIGPRWRHRPALFAAVSVLRGADRGYSVMYAGLEVDSGATQELGCDAIPTPLADGTLARIIVLHAGLDGSFACDLSTAPAGESPDEVLLFGGSMLGLTIVIVTTPTESIQLTGPALTPQNAVPLARALRPVERASGSV